MTTPFSFVNFPVGVVQFRVLAVLADHPHPAGRFPCRRCNRQDMPTWSRYADTVLKLNVASGLFETVEPGTADNELGANTFKREHMEAGPLCGSCLEVVDGRAPEEPRFTREPGEEARRAQP
ncbi:hypothetical protein HYW67_03170 [Candidatus Parcubacteria bacterium]|nr:hypothetical protein [Candidatus Parcubacteria bacterium]